MIFTDYRFLLDVHEINSQISLSFKQGDTGRVLYITLTENGDLFNIPQDCVAVFTALKPDGTIIFNDCEINGNEITYSTTAQTAAVSGKVDCELRLYGAGNTLITSPHFTVFVHPTVYADKIDSKDEVNTLTNLISEASALMTSVNEKLDNGDFIPKMEIGTVTTLPPGSMATASFTGTGAAPVLNLGIPMGEQGQAETLIPDTALSLDSTKPVQNRVITEALNEQKAAFEEHRGSKENPHGVTKAQLGLGSVDDTADMDKPVSTKQEAAIELAVTAAKNEMEVSVTYAKDTADEAKEVAEEAKTAADNAQAAADNAQAAADAITPASIGAEKARLQFTNISVSSFSSNATYADFPYRASVSLAGVTAGMVPEVVFGVADAMSGIFAPVAESYDGGVYIYSSEVPAASITIPVIILWR